MRRRGLYYLLLASLVLLLSGCGSSAPQPAAPLSAPVSIPPGYFYFHSAACAHCATVDAYLRDHSVRQRLFFIARSVDEDPASANLIKAMGERCGIPLSALSVPFFWDGQTCYMGEENVIRLLEAELEKRTP